MRVDVKPYSLDYWIARSTSQDIIKSIFKQDDLRKMTYVLGYLSESNVKIGGTSVSGEFMGDISVDDSTALVTFSLPETDKWFPYSLDYWIKNTSAEDLVQSILSVHNQERINEILGFWGLDKNEVVTIVPISAPQKGNLVIQEF